MFKQANKGELVRYRDSSHNIHADDGRSTTGHIFLSDGCPISWFSHKKETVALSSCEAEFISATEAAKQMIGLQELLGEITEKPYETTIIISTINLQQQSRRIMCSMDEASIYTKDITSFENESRMSR